MSFASTKSSTRDSSMTDTSNVVDLEYYAAYPNRWSKIRETLREPAAEFFGTMLMILFGNGVDCQIVLSTSTAVVASQKGGYLTLSLGWAVGVALGVWLSGGISGGHLNPAVTIAMAAFRGFSWRKVPMYIAAQVLGAMCGALVVYANYFHAIDLYEGGPGIRTVPGTASLFSTYALNYMTPVSAWWDEFVGTVVLLWAVCAITDKRNGPSHPALVPIALFLTILGISSSFGMQTGFAINPARDFGPRVATAMVGYGREVFTFRHQYWLWCPIVAPIVGALVGVFLYDCSFYTGAESPLNRPNVLARAAHARAVNAVRLREKSGSGMDEV